MPPTSAMQTPRPIANGRMMALHDIVGSAHSSMITPGMSATSTPIRAQPSDSPRRSPSSVSKILTMAKMATIAATPSDARHAQ